MVTPNQGENEKSENFHWVRRACENIWERALNILRKILEIGQIFLKEHAWLQIRFSEERHHMQCLALILIKKKLCHYNYVAG